jgi:ubiquinone/menaquinone biosynthesis C-methylase UbiE
MTEPQNKFHTWGGIWDLLANRLVSLMGITSGSRVLDIGTGGGSTLLAALRRIGPTGEVFGIDTDETWVAHVREEAKKCGLTNVRTFEMDAKQLDFQDATFDYVTTGFSGWDYCYDFVKGEPTAPDSIMKEIYRVLKTGGTAGISTWTRQEDTEWMESFVESFNYSPQRVYSKETVDGWEEIMAASEFNNPLLLHEVVEYTYPTIDNWWQEMLAYGWEWQLQELAKEQNTDLQNIRESTIDRMKGHTSKKGVSFQRGVLHILATKK